MSAAFGYVDHVILLQRLRSAVGLSGVILNWIDSFLYGHTQEIAYNVYCRRRSTFFLAYHRAWCLSLVVHFVHSRTISCRRLTLADDSRVYISTTVDELQLLSTSSPHAWWT